MSWIKINSREDLPKAQCECWVINGYETITHETYYFGLGGFIQSRTMSLRDRKLGIVAYWVIDKPMSPKEINKIQCAYVHIRINLRTNFGPSYYKIIAKGEGLSPSKN
jgi:hypothetical protein